LSLNVVHPNAAGIDIGNESHYVAVPPDRDAGPVRQFACFTEDVRQVKASTSRIRAVKTGGSRHGFAAFRDVRANKPLPPLSQSFTPCQR
jgi:hypothetical protein